MPGDAEFQNRVLLSALNLLEADAGPIIEDFPEEAPISGGPVTILSCPVSFKGKEETLTDSEKTAAALREEVIGMRNWYDISVEKRGRTTVGASGLEIDQVVDFICEFIAGNEPVNPRGDIALGYTVNLAIDDLKAYYYEAVTAQPGQETSTCKVLDNWFWTETAAAKSLYALRDICVKSKDGLLNLAGKMLLVPVEFANNL